MSTADDVVPRADGARLLAQRVARVHGAPAGEPGYRLRGGRARADPAFGRLRRPSPPGQSGRGAIDRRHAGAPLPRRPRTISWSLLRTRFDTSDDAAGRRAEDTSPPAPAAPDAFSVQGYSRVLEEAERLDSLRRDAQLVVSGWPREIDHLLSNELVPRGEAQACTSSMFSHAGLPDAGRRDRSRRRRADLRARRERRWRAFWKHRLVVVADDVRTLIGADRAGTQSDNAVVSETKAIAEIATSQVALDITLLSQRDGKSEGDPPSRRPGGDGAHARRSRRAPRLAASSTRRAARR